MNKQDILIRLLKEDKITKNEFLCFWDAMGLAQVTENKDPKYYHPSTEGTVTTSTNGDKMWEDSLFVKKEPCAETGPEPSKEEEKKRMAFETLVQEAFGFCPDDWDLSCWVTKYLWEKLN